MSYFKNFPSIYYDLNRDEKYKLATDILRRVTFNQSSKNVDSIYVKYDIKEGETPEEIAYNLYDNHTLYWVILLFNDIINKNKQWPMNSETMDAYIADKYPGTAYYITFDSTTLDQDLIKRSSGACATDTNDVYRTGIHTVKKGFVVTNADESKVATVYKWDSSYKRFVITSMTKGADFVKDETLYIKDENSILVKAIATLWRVSKYSETVNKFIDDNKNQLNQLGSYDDAGVQLGTELQRTADTASAQGGACEAVIIHKLLPFEKTVLGAYMEVSGMSSETLQWVTNYEAEQQINDDKRSINLLRPEVIVDVITQFEELISL
jgi:hypothetical protein